MLLIATDTMVAFARRLIQSHLARKVAEASGEDTKDRDKLAPGLMQLYSYYKPGLLPGDYTIEVTQSIDAETPSGHQSLQIANTRASSGLGTLEPQEFKVIVPRFSLDRSMINSYYPPDGHEDEGRILPHIVLNDPHYPWEIPAGTLSNMKGPIDSQDYVDGTVTKTRYRNMVPWVALLVFDVDELHFSDIDDIKELSLKGFETDADLAKQNASGYFTMTVKEYFSKLPTSAQVNYKPEFGDDEEGYSDMVESDESVKVIFPQQDLINKLVGQRFLDTDTGVDVEGFKYLAHVRHLNVEGSLDTRRLVLSPLLITTSLAIIFVPGQNSEVSVCWTAQGMVASRSRNARGPSTQHDVEYIANTFFPLSSSPPLPSSLSKDSSMSLFQ